jgi:hypothetical protein
MAGISKYNGFMSDTGVSAYIRQWRPLSVSPAGAVFAREAVARAEPERVRRAALLLWSAGKLADYGLGLGLEPVPEVLLHPSVIDRFFRDACVPDGTLKTLRSCLRAVGRRVVPQFYPADATLPQGRPGKPYSPAEIGGFLALADAQSTRARRLRASALVCLGAGAGLVRSGLRDVRGADVCCRSGGVLVDVRGPWPRAVPVLARYHDRLLDAAAFAGSALICGGTDPGRQNVTHSLVRALDGGGGLPRLEASRLRSTWLAGCSRELGLAAFLRAAGGIDAGRLAVLVAGLDPGSEEDAVRILGAARP